MWGGYFLLHFGSRLWHDSGGAFSRLSEVTSLVWFVRCDGLSHPVERSASFAAPRSYEARIGLAEVRAARIAHVDVWPVVSTPSRWRPGTWRGYPTAPAAEDNGRVTPTMKPSARQA